MLWGTVRQRRAHPFTAGYLAARALKHVPPSPRWHRFRVPWVAAIPPALALVGLAGPRLEIPKEDSLLVIWDRSASMGARSAAGARFERAIRDLPSRVSAPTELVGMPEALGRFDPKPADVELSRSDLRDRAWSAHAAGRRVLVVTDRPLADLPPQCGLWVVGEGGPNVGVTAAFVREDRRLAVFTQGSVDGGAPPEAVFVEDAAGERPIRLESRSLGVFLSDPLAFDFGSRIRVRLTEPDTLATDDSVDLVSDHEPWIVSAPLSGDPSLVRAFSAHPGVQVVRGSHEADLEFGGAERGAKMRLWVAPELPAQLSPVVTRGSGRLSSSHPAFQFVDDEWTDTEIVEVASTSEDEVLLRLGDRPLLLRRGRELFLLHDPERSAWSARESFPLTIAALVDGVLGERLASPRVWRSGQPAELPWASRDHRDPDGSPALVWEERGESWVTPERVGIWTYSRDGSGGARGAWSVGLLSASETSDATSVADEWSAPPEATLGSSPLELDRWLVWLAVGLALMAEARSWYRARGHRAVARSR